MKHPADTETGTLPGTETVSIGPRLKSIIERIENLTAQRKELAEDVKDIFTEAKSAGLSTKAIRNLLRERAHPDEETEYLVAMYRAAIEK